MVDHGLPYSWTPPPNVPGYLAMHAGAEGVTEATVAVTGPPCPRTLPQMSHSVPMAAKEGWDAKGAIP